MEKKVSIVVPIYNVEEYLSECLESLMSQTYENIEILGVNDGATDSSLSILESYAAKDKRIVVLTKKNGGLSDARNYGIAHATGDYIACVDSDDLVTSDMVEKLVLRLEETGSEIAVSDMEYFYDDGTVKFSDGGNFDCTSVSETPALIAINNSACNKLFCRSLFEDVEFPVGRYYEDLATVPILLFKAKKVAKVNEPLYRYRQRSGSIAHSANKKIFDIYDAIDNVIAYAKTHGADLAVLKELRHLYIVHGLDLTTLRIKDFDDRSLRVSYLMENMERLKRSYPDFKNDEAYRNVGFKKKIIFHLLNQGKMEQVLKLYDR